MPESATILDMLVFIAACTVVGGLAMLAMAAVAHAARWGMAKDDAAHGGEMTGVIDADVSEVTARRSANDGTFVCTCHHEMRDDGRGEWDSVTFEDVVDERCPIHGPMGRGWEWIDITTTADDGGRRCIRGGRTARRA